MDYIILFLLSCLGLSYILRYGEILNIPRRYLVKKFKYIKKLLSCSYCTGMWCGIFLSIFLYLTNFSDAYFIILLPFASCATAGLINDLMENKD